MDIKSSVARSQMKRFQRCQKSKMHLNTSDLNTTEPAHTEWNNRPAPRPEPTRWNFFGILLFCRSNLSWTPRVSWWRTLNIRIRALYSLIVSSPPHTLQYITQILIRCTFPTKGTFCCLIITHPVALPPKYCVGSVGRIASGKVIVIRQLQPSGILWQFY